MVEARRMHVDVVHNLDESVINTIVILFSVYTAKYAQEEFPCECVICLNEFEDNDSIGTLLFVPTVSISVAFKIGFLKEK